MGYYYDADVTLTITEPVHVALSLDLDGLHANLSSDSYAWKPGEQFRSAGNLIADLTEYLGWELYSKDATTVNGEPATVYEMSGNQKFGSGVDIVIAWLARHGVGLTINCSGEDGENWGYQNAVGNTSLREYSIASVPADELAVLKAAQALVEQIRSLTQASASTNAESQLKAIQDLLVGSTPEAVTATVSR